MDEHDERQPEFGPVVARLTAPQEKRNDRNAAGAEMT
jgi:hypothetical protein